MAAEQEITLTTTVREVMVRYPRAESVFNRYGLTGCGGPKGPAEPIGFFATVHHVDPDALLRELRSLPVEPQQEAPTIPAAGEEADIYRPFVKAALVTVLTVGCSLGAVNLAAMALAGVTDSFWEAVTQAHGHAQIFGWVGLFIMGVAYHVLPRLKATQLQARPLAVASFWLVLAGIVLRVVAQPLAESPSFVGILVLSAFSELVGASFFAYVLIRTLASNPASADFWDKYVVASAAWFWVTSVATVLIALYTTSKGLAVFPNGLDAPYLHVALMGFVAMMIFGITLRTIPVFMGLHVPNTKAFDAIFWVLNLSIVLKAGSGWADTIAGTPVSGLLGPIGAALEFGSLLAFIYFLGVLGTPERNIAEEGASRNYEKFIRAAYLWLLIAATMTAAYAAYQLVTGQPVPHALVSSYRHALTVGFISMIVIGMASRIIPVFTGVRLYSDLMLLGTFVLLNVGNALRVLTQPLADFLGGPVFAVMGVSGFIEVTGIALFVYNLWRTIDSPVEDAVPTRAPEDRDIRRDMVVADLLSAHPEALEVLVRYGFTQLRSPIGRSTLAKAVTIEEACRLKGVELEQLLADLRRACAPSVHETVQPAQDPRPITPLRMAHAPVSAELVTIALRGCYDPEIPVNIVDLGLVRDVQIEDGAIFVRMILTSPGCPMGDQMVDEVRETLAQLPGVEAVHVDLLPDPAWTPDLMTEEARRQLGMTGIRG